MRNYRISVRVEMTDADTGERVTYDTFDHYFPASEPLDGGCDDYATVLDGVSNAISELEVRYEDDGGEASDSPGPAKGE